MRILAFLFALVSFAVAGAYARTLQTADLHRIVDIEQPAISPQRASAFIVVRPNVAEGTYDRELRIVDATGRVQRVLVRGEGVTLPRWSPDGSELAYLQTRDGRMALIVWNSGRPRVLARVQGDINDFAWRPDGRAIAFSAYDAASAHDYFEVGDNDYTQTALTPPVHLWLVESSGAGLHRLTSGSWTLAPTDSGGMFEPEFSWSRDGR